MNDELSPFEVSMLPLNVMLKLYYDRIVKNQIIELYNKYKDSFKNNSAQTEFDEILKDSVKNCLTLLSTEYLKTLKFEYYNDEGLLFFMYCTLRNFSLNTIYDDSSIETIE
jgi:hypothetical protein